MRRDGLIHLQMFQFWMIFFLNSTHLVSKNEFTIETAPMKMVPYPSRERRRPAKDGSDPAAELLVHLLEDDLVPKRVIPENPLLQFHLFPFQSELQQVFLHFRF